MAGGVRQGFDGHTGSSHRRLRFGLPALVALLAGTITATSTSTQAARPTALSTITLGMGYVPNVQFAPFYMAAQRGYYRAAGLNVTFSYASSPNLLQLVGTGRVDLAIADGTDAIAARAASIPVTSVLTLYQRLPVAIFARSTSGIRRVSDLRGKSVGVPGPYGSTYVGLLAALHASGLSRSSVTIRTIGYTQAESVIKGTVTAAVGYSNNEPLLLRRHGYRVTTIEVGTVTNLVGAGVAAGQTLLSRHPAVVRAFVQATLHGLSDTIRHPAAAFAAARQVHGLTTLRGQDAADQYAVLLRSIQFWHNAATRTHGLGYADPQQWLLSEHLMMSIGQITHAPAVGTVVTDRYTAGGPRA